MGNNDLIDCHHDGPEPLLQPCMLLRPFNLFQCPAAAPVAYKIQQYCSYSIRRYNRFNWQQSCPGKEAVGGCPSSPCLPTAANACTHSCACLAPISWYSWFLLKCAGKPEAHVKALRPRPKQLKTSKLEVWKSPLTWSEATELEVLVEPKALIKVQCVCQGLKH